MTELERWSLQLCALAAAAAIARLLFPDLRKYGVFALLRAVLLLSALSALAPALGEAWREAAQPPAAPAPPLPDADGYYAAAAADAVAQALRQSLAADGINAEDVRIEWSVGEESVSLDAIVLSLQEDAPADLAAELSERWKAPVRIETGGGR